MKLRHTEKQAKIQIAVFLVATVLFAGLSVFGLVSNSNGAKERYDALIAVDQAGGDVQEALDELRMYIFAHMNTQIGSDLGINPPIQLCGTFERLVAEEQAKADAANSATDAYADAQEYCERTQPQGFSGSNRLDCIEGYLDEQAIPQIQPEPVEDDLYKFDFAPPVWSADLAGISMVLAGLSFIALLIQVWIYRRKKHLVQSGH